MSEERSQLGSILRTARWVSLGVLLLLLIYSLANIDNVLTLSIRVPLWALNVIPVIAFAAIWGVERFVRRRRAGLCPSCGYDRRGLATPTATCPECGAKE